MRPSLHVGMYVNAVGADSVSDVRAAYRAETFERLLALKRTYDPTNFFRLNPNINPGG